MEEETQKSKNREEKQEKQEKQETYFHMAMGKVAHSRMGDKEAEDVRMRDFFGGGVPVCKKLMKLASDGAGTLCFPKTWHIRTD